MARRRRGCEAGERRGGASGAALLLPCGLAWHAALRGRQALLLAAPRSCAPRPPRPPRLPRPASGRSAVEHAGVLHLPVRSTQPMLAALAEALPQLPERERRALLALGAVYYRPPGGGGFARVAAASAPLGAAAAAGAEARPAEAGGELRAHTAPRRYPACAAGGPAAWARRLLHAGPDFVVLDKPPGVPCAPHVSNGREWLAPFAAAALAAAGGPRGRLWPCHRLDAATSGLVALARSPDAAERFRELLAAGAVRKRYRALVAGRAPAPGALLELRVSGPVFGRPAPRLAAPRAAAAGAGGHRWHEARTRVLARRPLLGAWELLLQPRTGRTHQLRAQLAASGAPIAFDGLYEPLAGFVWRSEASDAEAERLVAEGAARPASEAIALQACALEFEDVAVEAPPPWWQVDEALGLRRRGARQTDEHDAQS